MTSAEGDWGDIESLPKPRSGVPRWLWACGCGCLFALILVGSGLFWGVGFVRKAMDPELAWQKLAEVVPYDEHPPGFEAQFGAKIPFVDWHVFQLSDRENGQHALLMALPVGETEERESFFETEEHGGEPTTINVQGRELRALHVDQNFEGSTPYYPGMPEGARAGRSVVVDLTAEGGRPLILVYTHESEEEPVPEEAVVEFLAPFHIGPDR